MRTFSSLFGELATEFVDYQFVINKLSQYRQPRMKLASLLKKGELVRIKKGLYLLGPPHFYGLCSHEILANLIYGPSYLSLETALSYYNLIPERVEMVTSITCNRNKRFDTPLGAFYYYYLNLERYSIGVTYQPIDQKRGFLIATKEKALCDCVARMPNLKHQDSLEDYLFGLRIGMDHLMELDLKNLSNIAKAYQCQQVNLLETLIIKYNERHKRSRRKSIKNIHPNN